NPPGSAVAVYVAVKEQWPAREISRLGVTTVLAQPRKNLFRISRQRRGRISRWIPGRPLPRTADNDRSHRTTGNDLNAAQSSDQLGVLVLGLGRRSTRECQRMRTHCMCG